jgi:putative transcriptional regulator
MDNRLFADLLQSANEALEHAKGKRELRTTELPPPPAPVIASDIRQLRGKMKMSQAVFAHCLNVSTKLVQAWESKRRTPEGPALLLLHLVQQQPSLILARWAVADQHGKKQILRARVGRRARGRKARRLVAA